MFREAPKEVCLLKMGVCVDVCAKFWAGVCISS